MIFSKPNAIVYVRRGGLVIAGKRISPARLNFPAEVISDMEVLLNERFSTGCQKFFSDHELRNKHVLVVLDGSIVFSKTVELGKTDKPAVIRDNFVEAMPLQDGKRACVSVQSQGELRLYATNAAIYKLITEALYAAGISKLLAITPAPAYKLEGDSQQLGNAMQAYITDTTVRAQTDFTTVQPN